MGQRPGVHHGGAASRCAPDRRQIEEIISVDPVKADNFVAQPLQKSRHSGAHLTAMSGDQNAHHPMIGHEPTATPTDIAGAVRLLR
jgi:hypothetical protein